MRAERIAERFDGLPDDVEHHAQVLGAFKAAAPRLGLSPRHVHAVDWLFKFTRPQDWEAGGCPIVWPSAARQQEELLLSERRVRALNRDLIEAGLISAQDSPSGKRYGIRDKNGRIIEAYGFDLSPLAVRYPEFIRVAAEAKAERELIGRLRRRVTIARKGITQILETVAEYGFEGEEWTQLQAETRRLVRHAREAERVEELTIDVGALERRKTEAFERLEGLPKTLKTVPKGAEYSPHNIPTNPPIYPEKDTVIAHEGSRSPPAPAVRFDPGQAPDPAPEPNIHPEQPTQTAGQPLDNRTELLKLNLSIDELTQLAPQLQPYLQTARPGWPEIVDAADHLRQHMGVSRSLWGEACAAMGGRISAAIAIAIVSAKPTDHFCTSPGGYFHGMVAKAKTGDLNLTRTIWGLRQTAGGKARPSRR